MNLTFLNLKDKGLLALSDLQNTVGKEARREIKRRQMIGYSDGTAINLVDKSNKAEEVFTILATPRKAPAARKVEKKIAGRGR